MSLTLVHGDCADPVADLSIIILSFNEAANIERCIASAKAVTDKVLMVDSFSTDNTVCRARRLGALILEHEFVNYAEQRNWAQEHNPFQTDWVLHLDADEVINAAFAAWLRSVFPRRQGDADGFMISRNPIFLGKALRFGGLRPVYALRLYRAAKGHCERRAYDQHFVVAGCVEKITGIYLDNDIAKDITSFMASHNRWSSLEAQEMFEGAAESGVVPRLFGTPIERRRWLKRNIFGRMPLFLRPFLYFLYRYVIRFGFLDGYHGLIFNVLQAFCFRFLVDAKYFELKIRAERSLPREREFSVDSAKGD